MGYNAYLLDSQGNSVFYKDKPDLSKGELYISVSSVLSMEGAGDFLIKWALREFGGQLHPIKAYDAYMDQVSGLGSALHKYIEYDLKKQEFPKSELTKEMLPGIESWENFKAEHDIELIDSERVLHSKSMRVAGTLDLRVKIDGTTYIADLKTGTVMDKAFVQLSAYSHFMKEMGISDGSEQLLVLGGADSKNKIANGGKVFMHTLDSWFENSVTQEDLFVYFKCLHHMWYIKNLRTKKFKPIIKGMEMFYDPLIESFRQSFIKPTVNKKGKTK